MDFLTGDPGVDRRSLQLLLDTMLESARARTSTSS
jgi:hypothetical protein